MLTDKPKDWRSLMISSEKERIALLIVLLSSSRVRKRWAGKSGYFHFEGMAKRTNLTLVFHRRMKVFNGNILSGTFSCCPRSDSSMHSSTWALTCRYIVVLGDGYFMGKFQVVCRFKDGKSLANR